MNPRDYDKKDDKPEIRKSTSGKPAPLVRKSASANLKPFAFISSDQPLDYANISKYTGKIINNYVVARMGNYIQLHYREKTTDLASPRIKERMKTFQNRQIQDLLPKEYGWKLHINVDPKDIDKAWSIIFPILEKFQITGIKIINPETVKDKNEKRQLQQIQGKQFTIYEFRNKIDKNTWEKLINEIETALKSNNIRPGKTPLANKVIEGSQYFSCRNDTHPTINGYISDVEAEAYADKNRDKNLKAYDLKNDPNYPNPFEGISLIPIDKPSVF